ncbi:hypothetical protein K7395_18960 [Streptomyces filamentosus]|uniref:DUF8175 domain-containing protein n=2 Tax=Streptomyces filamentosus TaxID=67294 RepID=A0ABY4UX08_STRFL|nr:MULTISPECIES: hypothetical protein [Streptomyces]EFE75747.1 integral membrane protein [Streptomyces filamentosus NRRL 15998]ESU49321.1 putative integral membrane protein [Streptomyces sp. HCCB10043]EWS92770.1 integral membrane protein [Streptomyces filamentosus NRRL 11379]MYR79796.1 hypothetical protein [Streptomyces sp. SID5466]USC48654.1 hypothetical protein K7395_18960 [Streptomyces filamentosus]
MSPGDEHDYRGKDQGGRADDPYSTLGGTRQTRTRLPDGDPGNPGARRPVRNSRSLVTITGIVVLLVAAIAFANRGGGGDDDASPGAKSRGTAGSAPTGTKPVQGKNGTIPSGFAHDEQGAQSAAANYAVALGSAEMFTKESRHRILDTVYSPAAADKLRSPQDRAYSAEFLSRLGLDPEGNAPQGSTFISRTVPVGTKVLAFDGDTAEVAVWYTGLLGMSGEDSTKPVSTTWKTWTAHMSWSDGDWKVTSASESDGPAPVPGDVAASKSDTISKAVEEYGGFTYAR